MTENDDIDLEGWDLHRAAGENRADVARSLIARGDGIDARDEQGETPLWYAVLSENYDFARLLIEHGATTEGIDLSWMDPIEWKKQIDEDLEGCDLHLAARGNRWKVAGLLIDRGADIDAKNKTGDTPMHYAAWFDSLAVAHELIRRGAKIEAKNNAGRTPLHDAASRNSVDVTHLLITSDAEFETKDNYGRTPLHGAAVNNSLDVARLLTDRGADIEVKDSDGWTPLHYAAEFDSTDVARLLIEHGVNT